MLVVATVTCLIAAVLILLAVWRLGRTMSAHAALMAKLGAGQMIMYSCFMLAEYSTIWSLPVLVFAFGFYAHGVGVFAGWRRAPYSGIALMIGCASIVFVYLVQQLAWHGGVIEHGAVEPLMRYGLVSGIVCLVGITKVPKGDAGGGL